MRLGMVGGGRAAWAFGSAWRAIGREIAGIHTRTPGKIETLLQAPQLQLTELVSRSEVVLVAVADSAMAQIAGEVTRTLRAETLAFHPSGALSSDVFTPHPLAFSLHPLRSLPPVGERCDFADTLFTFEGSRRAREFARDFVTRVGGHFGEINKEHKPLYHAAAVFASNYVAALLEIARTTLRASGIDTDVKQQLSKLAQSAIENWLRGEFTGPVARGDQEVIDRHLAALALDSDRAELYRLLAAELSKALQAKRF